MRSVEKTYTLFYPDTVDMFGDRKNGRVLGTVRCAVSRLTGEEIDENDIERTRQRYTGCVRVERAPIGGFVRGMKLASEQIRYNVLSAVLCGRLWLLALDRVIMEGDAADV